MKVKIGNKVIDAKKEPVLLIFDNDKEKDIIAGQILCMPPKEGIRKYAMFPDKDGTNHDEIRDWMKDI
jgi:hypothetical protein